VLQEKTLSGMESEIATLIAENLDVCIDADKIDPDAPIFGDGLGLDSIDALEIAFLLTRQYGVTITQGNENNKVIFSSLRALGQFVADNRTL
jgi:acyl carrier protein